MLLIMSELIHRKNKINNNNRQIWSHIFLLYLMSRRANRLGNIRCLSTPWIHYKKAKITLKICLKLTNMKNYWTLSNKRMKKERKILINRLSSKFQEELEKAKFLPIWVSRKFMIFTPSLIWLSDHNSLNLTFKN